jgi:hypothetical protein
MMLPILSVAAVQYEFSAANVDAELPGLSLIAIIIIIMIILIIFLISQNENLWGRSDAFYDNFGMVLRAFSYIRFYHCNRNMHQAF